MYDNEHAEADQHGEIDPRDAYTARVVADQLVQLAGLRAVGMKIAGRLGQYVDDELSKEEAAPFVTNRGAIAEFACLSRSIRQIISMEQELLGLREMPDGRPARPMAPPYVFKSIWKSWRNDEADPDDLAEPSDLREPCDLYDYDDGPAVQVIADICETLIALGADIRPPVMPVRPPSGSFVRSRDSSAGRDATRPSHAHDPP